MFVYFSLPRISADLILICLFLLLIYVFITLHSLQMPIYYYFVRQPNVFFVYNTVSAYFRVTSGPPIAPLVLALHMQLKSSRSKLV
jgi:hypothetical protein